MISSLLLAFALAQPAAPPPGAAPAPSGPAEPAPAEPTPPTPTGPAEPAPSEAQPTPTPAPTSTSPSTSPSPPISGSGSAVAPPRSPAAPVAPLETTAQAPSNTASLLGGLAYRPGNALPPVTGFSIAGAFHRRYATLPADLDLGWQLDFSFDRFSMSVTATASGAGSAATTYPGQRTISDTSFGALQTLSAHAGSSRFWLGAGGGLSIGFLATSEPQLDFGTATSYQPFARAVAGVDFALDQQTGVQVRVGYAHALTSSTVASGGQSWELIGDLLDIHAGLFYRFR